MAKNKGAKKAKVEKEPKVKLTKEQKKKIAAAAKAKADKEKAKKKVEDALKKGDIPADAFVVTLDNSGEVFQSIDADLVEAFLNLKPSQIKFKAMLTVVQNDKKVEKLFMARQLKKSFVDRTFATFLAKQIITQLQ